MLHEIYCEEFHQKKIIFNDGLSVVLGTNSGDNSIGKSTFLMIIDFVFGGDTYAKSTDILRNVPAHDIFFSFDFGGNLFYFSRNNIRPNDVWRCNEEYGKVTSMTISEFRQWLDHENMLGLPSLSFRDVVGRYIRVYGKYNYDEQHPLHCIPNEKLQTASYALLKLFDYYSPISALEEQANSSSEALKAYQKAQYLQFISNIGKRDFTQNEKDISKLEEELEELSYGLEEGLLDVDAEASEAAIYLKSLLSRARRLRSSVKSHLESLNENAEYRFSPTEGTFQELQKFFPGTDIKKLSNIETFHGKISSIFKTELQEEKRKLETDLEDYRKLISDYEAQLKGLIKNPKLSRVVLSRHSELLRQIEKKHQENKSYNDLMQLKKTKAVDYERLIDIQRKQFAILSNQVNAEMRRINDLIYAGSCNSPLLTFTDTGYTFFTPDDTGTGVAFKGLVVFDLSVLKLTKLPILAHDSIILKHISDTAIEKIIELYLASRKQVIIALDKQDSYMQQTTELLNAYAVLKLAPEGKELFGRSWG